MAQSAIAEAYLPSLKISSYPDDNMVILEVKNARPGASFDIYGSESIEDLAKFDSGNIVAQGDTHARFFKFTIDRSRNNFYIAKQTNVADTPFPGPTPEDPLALPTVVTNTLLTFNSPIPATPVNMQVRIGTSDLDSDAWENLLQKTVELNQGDGIYSILIAYVDPANGQVVQRSQDVRLDTTAPTITLDLPVANQSTTIPLVTIRGHCPDQKGVDVSYSLQNVLGNSFHNPIGVCSRDLDEASRQRKYQHQVGTPVLINYTNQFKGYLSLAPGTNFLTVVAQDRAGLTAQTNFTINVDFRLLTQAPGISIQRPNANAVMSSDRTNLEGQVQDPTAKLSAVVTHLANPDEDPVDLLVEVTADGKFWATDIPLAIGDNDITITSQNRYLLSLPAQTQTVRVQRTDPSSNPPTLWVAPAFEINGVEPRVTVSGVLYNADPAAHEVWINETNKAEMDAAGNWNSLISVSPESRIPLHIDLYSTSDSASPPANTTPRDSQTYIQHRVTTTFIDSYEGAWSSYYKVSDENGFYEHAERWNSEWNRKDGGTHTTYFKDYWEPPSYLGDFFDDPSGNPHSVDGVSQWSATNSYPYHAKIVYHFKGKDYVEDYDGARVAKQWLTSYGWFYHHPAFQHFTTHTPTVGWQTTTMPGSTNFSTAVTANGTNVTISSFSWMDCSQTGVYVGGDPLVIDGQVMPVLVSVRTGVIDLTDYQHYWPENPNGTDGLPIDGEKVTVMGVRCDPEAWTYHMLFPGQTYVTTPEVSRTRAQIRWGQSAYDHPLRLFANNQEIFPNKLNTNAYWTVATKIRHEATFDSRPSNLDDMLVTWKFGGGRKINRKDPPPVTGASARYSYDKSKLRVHDGEPCDVWWINPFDSSRGSGDAELESSALASLVFKYGQTFDLSKSGRLRIHRPTVVDIVPQVPNFFTVTDYGLPVKVQLGDSDGAGAMSWDAQIRTKIEGAANLTQLLVIHYSNLPWPPSDNNNFNEWRCDGPEFYNSSDTGIVARRTAPFSVVSFTDGPKNIAYLPNTMQGNFQTFIVWRGDGFVPAPLGRVDWGMNITCHRVIIPPGTTNYPSTITAPSFMNTDMLPQWDKTRPAGP
jgi:hypothetical protein